MLYTTKEKRDCNLALIITIVVIIIITISLMSSMIENNKTNTPKIDKHNIRAEKRQELVKYRNVKAFISNCYRLNGVYSEAQTGVNEKTMICTQTSN